jgi:hypothetical protein
MKAEVTLASRIERLFCLASWRFDMAIVKIVNEITLSNLTSDLGFKVKPDLTTRTCLVETPDGTIDTDLFHYLVDQTLPRLLAHDGRLVLHAGAVRAGGQGIAFIAPSGHGKSTLTGSFHKAGHPLISDDTLVLDVRDGRACTRPIHPGLRLLPDSLGFLFGAEEQAQAIPASRGKHRMPVTVAAPPVMDETPLRALFVLAHPDENDAITLTPLTPAQSCIEIIANSFAHDPADTREAKARFEQASALARFVPCLRLTYPRDYARLPEVRQAILRAAEGLASTTGRATD